MPPLLSRCFFAMPRLLSYRFRRHAAFASPIFSSLRAASPRFFAAAMLPLSFDTI